MGLKLDSRSQPSRWEFHGLIKEGGKKKEQDIKDNGRWTRFGVIESTDQITSSEDWSKGRKRDLGMSDSMVSFTRKTLYWVYHWDEFWTVTEGWSIIVGSVCYQTFGMFWVRTEVRKTGVEDEEKSEWSKVGMTGRTTWSLCRRLRMKFLRH